MTAHLFSFGPFLINSKKIFCFKLLAEKLTTSYPEVTSNEIWQWILTGSGSPFEWKDTVYR